MSRATVSQSKSLILLRRLTRTRHFDTQIFGRCVGVEFRGRKMSNLSWSRSWHSFPELTFHSAPHSRRSLREGSRAAVLPWTADSCPGCSLTTSLVVRTVLTSAHQLTTTQLQFGSTKTCRNPMLSFLICESAGCSTLQGPHCPPRAPRRLVFNAPIGRVLRYVGSKPSSVGPQEPT